MHSTHVRLPEGVDVVLHRSGPPGTTTAVLVHGIGMTHRTFADLQPLLASHGPVVSVDLPGFGATARPSRAFSIADHAAALDAALERTGVGRRVLVGHSMGAQVAVEHAVRRPDVVAGMVLVGPVVDRRRRSLGAQARDLGLDTLREPPGVNARVLTDYIRGGPGWYLATLRTMFAYDIAEQLTRARVPVVVVRGEHDPVARHAWCRQLVAAATGPAELVTVPGSAHVVPITGSAPLAGVIARLVDAGPGTGL